jgi:hypothetical protein
VRLEVNLARPGKAILTVEIGGTTSAHPLAADGWCAVTAPAPAGLAGEVAVTLTVSPTFDPQQPGSRDDNHELGVLVRQLGFALAGQT